MSAILIWGAGLNDDKIANNRYLEPTQAYNRYLEPRQAYESFYSVNPPTLVGKLKIIP